jgi:hypothetical protein
VPHCSFPKISKLRRSCPLPCLNLTSSSSASKAASKIVRLFFSFPQDIHFRIFEVDARGIDILPHHLWFGPLSHPNTTPMSSILESSSTDNASIKVLGHSSERYHFRQSIIWWIALFLRLQSLVVSILAIAVAISIQTRTDCKDWMVGVYIAVSTLPFFPSLTSKN